MIQQTPQHTKVRTIKEFEDGTFEINSHSMHKKLSSTKQEIGQHVETNALSLAADIIACLKHLTFRETEELTLHITCDKVTGEPTLITKTWVTDKEYYGKNGGR